jgi:ATP-binding cassette subfamily F protein uup
MGDGSCVLLPGGVEQYLDSRRNRITTRPASGGPGASVAAPPVSPADARRAKKDLARLEQQIARIEERVIGLYEQMADAASDHQRLLDLQSELDRLAGEKDGLELAWLEAAEVAG